nr:Triosephosphate isomerase [uncultured bacterium]
MNGGLASNANLLNEVMAAVAEQAQWDAVDVLVCVPAPYLSACQTQLHGSRIRLGAQDVSQHASGAYTGEVAAYMLREFACQYVIVGHSERRSYHAEVSEIVAAKAKAALLAGLTPIICMGETLEQREAGQTDLVVGAQLDAALATLSEEELARSVFAYEPIWAIGTGKTATPEMAQAVHAMVRERIASKHPQVAQTVQILYGGSMKPDNAKQLLAMPDIDGGLIGGAALVAAQFLAIVQAAA